MGNGNRGSAIGRESGGSFVTGTTTSKKETEKTEKEEEEEDGEEGRRGNEWSMLAELKR